MAGTVGRLKVGCESWKTCALPSAVSILLVAQHVSPPLVAPDAILYSASYTPTL